MLFVDEETTPILMVSYHRPNDFRRSVRSILNNTDCPYHLTIIDNSSGGLDQELSKIDHKNVTIRKNTKNIGKAVAINEEFVKAVNTDHFITIDGDVIVPKGWLIELKRSYYAVKRVGKPGIIAPAILDSLTNTWTEQVKNNKLVMHQIGHLKQTTYYNGLYENRYNAGPLFLIDTQFFKSAGLYYEGQLYGADDGMLCNSAAKMNRFMGINSNVQVIHSNTDSTREYVEWKKRNITRDVDQHGHWD